MSYANMDAVPTQTAGTSELLASDWNTYVRDNFDSIKFGHVVCTSSTRPTGIAEGTMIYETDTDKVLVYSGSAWVAVINALNGTATSVVGRSANSSGERADISTSTDGDVLRRSGGSLGFGTITMSSVSDGGLIKITDGTFSSASSVNIFSVFTDTYRNYRLILDNISFSAAAALYWRVASGTTTNNSSYYHGFRGWASNGSNGDTRAANTTGGYTGCEQGAARASIDFYQPKIATNTVTTAIGSSVYSGEYWGRAGTAAHDVSTAYDGLYLFPGSGTVSGTYTLYAYKN